MNTLKYNNTFKKRERKLSTTSMKVPKNDPSQTVSTMLYQ